jgi:hypothetical protein
VTDQWSRERFLERVAFIEKQIETWRGNPGHVDTLRMEAFALRLAAGRTVAGRCYDMGEVMMSSPVNETAGAHPVEKLWREVGLPEYFLGNGGTNTKLYALYDAIRSVRHAQSTQTRNETLRGLAEFFSESVHLLWSNDEIADCLTNMIDTAPALTSPDGKSAS